MKRIRRRVACAGILALTALTGCATTAPSNAPLGSAPSEQVRSVLGGQGGTYAQPMASQLQMTPALSSEVDQQFTTGSGQTNMAEQVIGQLAMQRSQNEGVRALAQLTMRDHAAVQTQLTSAAPIAALSLPQSVSSEQSALATKLSTLSGAEFDLEYAKAQVQGHERSVTSYEREISQGKNESIRAVATQNLATIREHLRHSKALLAQLDTSSTAQGDSTDQGMTSQAGTDQGMASQASTTQQAAPLQSAYQANTW